jgi:hypothetical protein
MHQTSMANLYRAAVHGEARFIHLSVVTRATSQLDKGNVSYRSILADAMPCRLGRIQAHSSQREKKKRTER